MAVQEVQVRDKLEKPVTDKIRVLFPLVNHCYRVPRETPGQTVSAQYCREGLPSSVRELSLGAQRGTRRQGATSKITREHSQKLLPVWKQELAMLESGGWRGGGVKVCVAGLEAGIRVGNIK